MSWYIFPLIQFVGFLVFFFFAFLAIKKPFMAWVNEEDLSQKTRKELFDMIRWRYVVAAFFALVFAVTNPFMSF